jgi:hydrogenase-4 component F
MLYVLLAAPLIAGLLSLLPSQKLRELTTISSSAIVFALSIYLILNVRFGNVIENKFFVDIYSALVVLLVASTYFFSAVYSSYYIKTVKAFFLSRRIYYTLLNFFALSMIFAAITPNLGLMWVGLEATTTVSAMLVALERKKASIEAAWRYMIIASAGLGFALLSLVVIYHFSKTLDWYAVKLPVYPAALAAVLALVGFGTKIGLFPMHTWLPDAHGTAPPPVSAMLSASLLPVAFLAYFRVFSIAMVSHAYMVSSLTVFFGVTTALIAAFLTIPQKIFKRLFAYSSMDIMGIATVGIGLGKEAAYASFLLLIIHGFAKSGLFYCSGNIIASYKTGIINEVSGLLNSLKLTGLALILGSLAVTGAPPFASFIAELVILAYSLKNPCLTAAIATAIFISFSSINYHVTKMAFGESTRRRIPLYVEIVPLLSTLIALGISFGVLGVLLR